MTETSEYGALPADATPEDQRKVYERLVEEAMQNADRAALRSDSFARAAHVLFRFAAAALKGTLLVWTRLDAAEKRIAELERWISTRPT